MQVYFTSQEVKLLSLIWYLKCGQRWMGPYSYPELALMLLSKSITRHQHIRSNEDHDWKKLSECTYFSQKYIENFLTNYSPRHELGKIRSHIRIETKNSPVVIINKEGHVINAKCVQLSAGGARIEVPFESISVGEEIKIHFPFNNSLKIKSFNSSANILRQEKISIVEGQGSSESFSIQFVGLRARYKKQILKFVQKEVMKIYKQIKNFEDLEAKIDFVKMGIRRSDLMRVDSEESSIILAG